MRSYLCDDSGTVGPLGIQNGSVSTVPSVLLSSFSDPRQTVVLLYRQNHQNPLLEVGAVFNDSAKRWIMCWQSI